MPFILGVSAAASGARVDRETRDAATVFDAGWQRLGGVGGADGRGGHDVQILADRETWVHVDHDNDKHALIRRAAAGDGDLPSSSRTSSKESASTPSASAGSAQETASIANPTAFDSVSLTTNLTSSCSGFLTHVATDTEFKNCLPLSGFVRVSTCLSCMSHNTLTDWLVQDSSSFFNIMKQGAFKTTVIMDRVCAVDFNRCAALMEGFSGQLQDQQYCKADYDAQNPVVTNMFTTLITYKPLYTAGCLRATDGDYCFVDAVTNTDNPEDLYIYSLPLGNPLPGGSQPTYI